VSARRAGGAHRVVPFLLASALAGCGDNLAVQQDASVYGTGPAAPCTAAQCAAATTGGCGDRAHPVVCLAGNAKNGCFDGKPPRADCTDACSWQGCTATLPPCQPDECAALADAGVCPVDQPYTCTARGGCSAAIAEIPTDCWASACNATSCAPVPACAPGQCAAFGDRKCDAAHPLACTAAVGGCYAAADPNVHPDCLGKLCDFAPCACVSKRAQRTITFVNHCDVGFAVVQDGTRLIEAAEFGAGARVTRAITLQANATAWGTCYATPAGLKFAAVPDDGDLANTTLFEIAFGAYAGAADVYDLSAIPPDSCPAKLSPLENDYGYADHLPYKDAGASSQSWACLKDPDGGVDPKTCGDGRAWQLCPAVVTDAGVALTAPALTASRTAGPDGGVRYGCGVPGERCCGPPTEGDPCPTPPDAGASCCPEVCGLAAGEDPNQHDVRNRLYRCTRAQARVVADTLPIRLPDGGAPRQTGFWKALKVEARWPDGGVPAAECRPLTCRAGSDAGVDFSDMATTCADGYLWPYDDRAATVTCPAAPDYELTFCPAS
jgi:hypothetical protein